MQTSLIFKKEKNVPSHTITSRDDCSIPLAWHMQTWPDASWKDPYYDQ